MKILFLSHYFYPHIGGVEKHTLEVAKELVKKGHKVTVVTERYDESLKDTETFEGIKIIRFDYPHIKIIGIKFIWLWFIKNYRLIKNADVVHCHDVFIWYLFSRLIFPNKKVFVTHHGWEGTYPVPWQNKLLKQIASKLCNGTISVGEYIQKYYGVKPNIVVYGGKPKNLNKMAKVKNSIVFVGRLEPDTGVNKFIESLKQDKYNSVDFVGGGSLSDICSKHGKVHGFVDPTPFLQKSEYAVPAGYLSYIEAFSYGCKIITYADNSLKNDYWNEIKKIKNFPTWEGVTKEYLKLWGFEI